MVKTRADVREREREYWARPENKEKKRAKDKRYYEKHKSKILEQTKAYSKTHPEQRKETCKRYYRNHKEQESKRMMEYIKNNPEKYKAHQLVRRAILKGTLAPAPCERCGVEKAFAHHDDYDKPLEVKWLCHSCHMAFHAQLKKESKNVED